MTKYIITILSNLKINVLQKCISVITACVFWSGLFGAQTPVYHTDIWYAV